MAAGIAHEIRNPMTTVRGFLQMFSQKKDYFADKEFFDLMIDELDRANIIISEFLSLAKGRIVEFKLQNINKIIKKITPLIWSDAMVFGSNVEFKLRKVTDIFIDEKEIRQLILNLSRNGLEAMPNRGTLTIRTYEENEVVFLEISDEGTGITSEVLDKLGTPFITTKEKGTGLGLAVCYSIATRHDAKIMVETSPKGTKFIVNFKAVRKK
jgi:signal transduction histidine kinase